MMVVMETAVPITIGVDDKVMAGMEMVVGEIDFLCGL